jgi:hypothetical protein
VRAGHVQQGLAVVVERRHHLQEPAAERQAVGDPAQVPGATPGVDAAAHLHAQPADEVDLAGVIARPRRRTGRLKALPFHLQERPQTGRGVGDGDDPLLGQHHQLRLVEAMYGGSRRHPRRARRGVHQRIERLHQPDAGPAVAGILAVIATQ